MSQQIWDVNLVYHQKLAELTPFFIWFHLSRDSVLTHVVNIIPLKHLCVSIVSLLAG